MAGTAKKSTSTEKSVASLMKACYMDRIRAGKDIIDELDLQGDVKIAKSDLQRKIIDKDIELQKAVREVEKAKATSPLNIEKVLDNKMEMRKTNYELKDLIELSTELFPGSEKESHITDALETSKTI